MITERTCNNSGLFGQSSRLLSVQKRTPFLISGSEVNNFKIIFIAYMFCNPKKAPSSPLPPLFEWSYCKGSFLLKSTPSMKLTNEGSHSLLLLYQQTHAERTIAESLNGAYRARVIAGQKILLDHIWIINEAEALMFTGFCRVLK